MNNFAQLEQAVVQWHRDRNLIEGSTNEKQIEKLQEEVDELRKDIIENEAHEDGKDLKDELGDCLVVLINIAARNGFTLQDALTFSYNKIKNRKGKMVDGQFVKEEDL